LGLHLCETIAASEIGSQSVVANIHHFCPAFYDNSQSKFILKKFPAETYNVSCPNDDFISAAASSQQPSS
jgi:hypothetical protein